MQAINDDRYGMLNRFDLSIPAETSSVEQINRRIRKVGNSSQESSLYGCLDNAKCQHSSDTQRRHYGMVEEVGLPRDVIGDRTCFVINDVLSADECNLIISTTEAKEFRPALIDLGQGDMMMPENRKLDQCTMVDKAFAEILYQRISDVLPTTMRTGGGSVWKPASLSERMRVLRYGPGHYVTSHRDGAFSRHDNECSFLTVIVYLNDGKEDFTGGTTNFLRRNSHSEETSIIGQVIPRRGSILIFDHNLLHEGAKLVCGWKYAIRTEVLYTRDTRTRTKDLNIPVQIPPPRSR